MRKIIIADTSCLILLSKISALEILKRVFEEITVTTIIAEEFGEKLPSFFILKDAENKNYQNTLQASVDKGEASAIALAVEQDDCLLILDDQRARTLATELHLKHTGTLGVLVEAKLSGHISSLKPLLIKIRETNFRISSELERKILLLAGE